MARLERKFSGTVDHLGFGLVGILRLTVPLTPRAVRGLTSNADAYLRRTIEGTGMPVNGYLINDAGRAQLRRVALKASGGGPVRATPLEHAHIEKPRRHKSKIIWIGPDPHPIVRQPADATLKRIGQARVAFERVRMDPTTRELRELRRDPEAYFTKFFQARGETVNDIVIEKGALPKLSSGKTGGVRTPLETIVVHIIEGKRKSRRLVIKNAMVL